MQSARPLFEKGDKGCDIVDIAAFAALHMLDVGSPGPDGFRLKGGGFAPYTDKEGVASMLGRERHGDMAFSRGKRGCYQQSMVSKQAP